MSTARPQRERVVEVWLGRNPLPVATAWLEATSSGWQLDVRLTEYRFNIPVGGYGVHLEVAGGRIIETPAELVSIEGTSMVFRSA